MCLIASIKTVEDSILNLQNKKLKNKYMLNPNIQEIEKVRLKLRMRHPMQENKIYIN